MTDFPNLLYSLTSEIPSLSNIYLRPEKGASFGRSIPYPRVNCLKTIPFTAAHTYIAHIWQYRPPPPASGASPYRPLKELPPSLQAQVSNISHPTSNIIVSVILRRW